MERWAKKVAIVTGASSGIGAAIALQLAENGVSVVGVARRSERIQELRQKLSKDYTGKLYGLKCDVNKEEDILRVFQWTKEHLGNVHILINNAGFGKSGPFVETTAQLWRDIFDTNVIAVAIFTREFLKQASENNIAGHIVSISSVYGLQVENASTNALAPTKFALQALQEVVRQELAQAKSKIKVTTVCPGRTETEAFYANVNRIPQLRDVQIESIPKLQAEDVANAVLFALSTPPDVQIQQIVMRPLGG